MRRFVLQANIAHFQAVLAHEEKASTRDWLLPSIAAARRELAGLDAAADGLRFGMAPLGSRLAQAGSLQSGFAQALSSTSRLQLLLEPGPGLHIVDASGPYANATMTERSRIAGQALFEVFPDDPEQPLADGVSNLFASLQRAARTLRADRMPIRRYDVRDASGAFVERYWRPSNTPIFDADGHLIYIMHEVMNVTEDVTRWRAAERLR